MNQDRKRVTLTVMVVACLLGIFAFLDLPITQAIFNPKSKICIVFEVLGELPATLTAIFCSMYLFIHQKNPIMWKRVLSKIGYGMIILLGASMGCMLSLSYIHMLNAVTMLIGMLIFIVAAYIVASRIPEKYHDKMSKVAIMGLFLFLFSMVSFNLIKMGWGRMRYVFMDNPAIQFSPWYVRQGFTSDNTFMSFPSGHGAQSSFILMITLLPLVFDSLKGKATVLTMIAYLWIVTICVSRVILGRHFASDVTMGYFVTFVYFELLRHFYLNKAFLKIEKK